MASSWEQNRKKLLKQREKARGSKEASPSVPVLDPVPIPVPVTDPVPGNSLTGDFNGAAARSKPKPDNRNLSSAAIPAGNMDYIYW